MTDRLHFPVDIRESIVAMWARNQAIAKQSGTTLAPMQFVDMFVGSNVKDFWRSTRR